MSVSHGYTNCCLAVTLTNIEFLKCQGDIGERWTTFTISDLELPHWSPCVSNDHYL